ncbi:HD domain-containing protein [Bacillus sp. HMF5848]|uniref:bis(5'-nucleosyl)-tetraphosphatase (symmetrical) YqeK n=1 Tax=Bacillus sp. HMF5848 TaxID=2495421 RepID=UPI000F79AC68|nr:bis(5'-nucleosyl)-tetraphosphatase (symmetrical) YqeK [Bacillus sp. HMF5848]RSK27920.1 HD domain-containing protein [Bacillus sp. HMF5848]
MDRTEALHIVKQQLTDHRYQHTLGVVESAIELAQRYGVDEKQAELAAIFHDYAKYRSKKEMRKIVVEQQMDEQLLFHSSELLHAPVGAYLVEKEVGISDTSVLSAIKYHTSGRANMTMLEKVIYVADYIEPGRQFPGVEEARDLAKQSIHAVLHYAVTQTILYLLKKDQAIYPDTLALYNDLIINHKEDIS